MIRGAFDGRRAAQASVAALVAVPVGLLAAGMVLYVVLVRDARTETQNGSDAAALAAARMLATDDFLSADPERAEACVRRARAAALQLGAANVAGGERLTLDPNEVNHPEGDLAFGHLDRPLDGTFTVPCPGEGGKTDWVGARINAVRVTLRRPPVRPLLGGAPSDQEVLGRTVAMLDFAVVGFRPLDGATVPLVPIGLYTDHTGDDEHAWDAHLKPDRVTDLWRFDPEKKTFTEGGDGIPEVVVIIGGRSRRGKGKGSGGDPATGDDSGSAKKANSANQPTPGDKGGDDSKPASGNNSGSKRPVPGVFLQIGVDSFAETVKQVESGCRCEQLKEKFGSGFVLTEANILDTPGTPDCPPPGAFDEALERVIASGEPRLWPLFTDVDPDCGLVRLNGWVGARVVAAGRHPGGGVKLILQPAVICHPSAVTERRSPAPAYWGNNRTVCRVRLAE